MDKFNLTKIISVIMLCICLFFFFLYLSIGIILQELSVVNTAIPILAIWYFFVLLKQYTSNKERVLAKPIIYSKGCGFCRIPCGNSWCPYTEDNLKEGK